MITLLPRDLPSLADAARPLVVADTADLRGAGLPAHRKTRLADARGIGGTALLVDDRAHSVEHQGNGVWVETERREVARGGVSARRHWPLGANESRRHGPAGDEPRNHRGELQRRCQHRALADAGD